ncbi:MAG TPA: hypothetical protein VMB18_01945, partial [Terriglobales bacterium]|nr:hypothetical protein [Terriglobales bacterium]
AVGPIVGYTDLSGLSTVAKVSLASVWAGLPVIFSGLIFSSRIDRMSSLASGLSANLLGAVLGGMLENVVLLVGTPAMGWVACFIFAAAWASGARGTRSVANANRELWEGA